MLRPPCVFFAAAEVRSRAFAKREAAASAAAEAKKSSGDAGRGKPGAVSKASARSAPTPVLSSPGGKGMRIDATVELPVADAGAEVRSSPAGSSARGAPAETDSSRQAEDSKSSAVERPGDTGNSAPDSGGAEIALSPVPGSLASSHGSSLSSAATSVTSTSSSSSSNSSSSDSDDE